MATQSHSPRYRRFLDSLNAGITSRAQADSLDLDALLGLDASERDAAETELIDRLDKVADGRLVDALVAIKSARAHDVLLRALASARHSAFRTAAARGLMTLYGDATGRDAIVTTLRFDPDWSARTDAAASLRWFSDKASVDALLQALRDPERLVRINATDALFALTSVERIGEGHAYPLGMQRILLGSPVSTISRDAALAIEDAVTQLRKGNTASQLGLDLPVDVQMPGLQKVLTGLQDRGGAQGPPELDLSDWATLTPEQRRWVENTLLAWLPGQPRIVRALATIGGSRVKAALKDVQSTAQGDLLAAVDAALQALP